MYIDESTVYIMRMGLEISAKDELERGTLVV